MAVFEPRSYTSRTRVFEADFARSFASADLVHRGRRPPAGEGPGGPAPVRGRPRGLDPTGGHAGGRRAERRGDRGPSRAGPPGGATGWSCCRTAASARSTTGCSRRSVAAARPLEGRTGLWYDFGPSNRLMHPTSTAHDSVSDRSSMPACSKAATAGASDSTGEMEDAMKRFLLALARDGRARPRRRAGPRGRRRPSPPRRRKAQTWSRAKRSWWSPPPRWSRP